MIRQSTDTNNCITCEDQILLGHCSNIRYVQSVDPSKTYLPCPSEESCENYNPRWTPKDVPNIGTCKAFTCVASAVPDLGGAPQYVTTPEAQPDKETIAAQLAEPLITIPPANGDGNINKTMKGGGVEG